MGFIYQVFVNSSKEDAMKKLNKHGFGRANIVYGMDGEVLELSRRSRIKTWEEDRICSTMPEITNIVES